ncbi:hypothetical protein EDD15DRAFT_2358114 [Pisolithus albus]|nr:hypothetical protein EDD15DRAFT_2358114 [Pisolithus albus]
MADAGDLGDIAVRAPSPSPNMSLFERMRCAQVPLPPSLTEERVPSSQEDAEMELAEGSRDTTAGSPLPMFNLSLYERMKRAPVPKPPSPAPASDMDLFNRMWHARVPSPPSPCPGLQPMMWISSTGCDMRKFHPRHPPLQSFPMQATEVDTSKKLQSAEAPSPPSQCEGLQIEQEDEPDRSGRIDFSDPDRARLQEWFMLGLTGPSLSADDRLTLECAGLANADTADDVLRALQDLKSWHVSPASAGKNPYEKTLDLHIVRV